MRLLCFILCWSFTLMLSSYAQPILPIQEKDLAGGGHLYFVPSKQLPMLDIKVMFHAGSSYDQTAWGLASLTNALLEEGSQDKSASEIADILASHGAQLHFTASRLGASLSLRVLRDPHYLNGALDVFHDILVHPSFPSDAFKRVRDQVLVGIKLRQQSPSTLAQDAFYQSLYDGLPYAHSVHGVTSTVQGLTEKNIRDFYHQYYVRNNADVVIVGDGDLVFAEKLAQKLLSGMNKGKQPVKLPLASSTSSALIKHIHFPSQQTTYCLGQVGISRDDPNYFGLLVGNELLGGNQERARLFEVLRNQNGLVYGIYSVLSPAPFRGPYFITFKAANASAQRALTLVREQVKLFLTHGVSLQELAVAKKKMIGGFYLKFSSNSQLLSAASTIAFYQLPLNYWDKYLKGIKQVGQKDISHAFSTMIHPAQWVVVSVGSGRSTDKK